MRHPLGGFVGAGAVWAAAWAWSWHAFPARVPVHFGATGRPDGWTGRDTALRLTGLLGLGTVILFAVLTAVVWRIRVELLNVPHPEYWKQPEHLGELRRKAQVDLLLLGGWTLLLLAAVQVLIVRAAQLPDPRLGPWAAVVVGIYLVVVLGRLTWLFTRGYAVPGPPDGSSGRD